MIFTLKFLKFGYIFVIFFVVANLFYFKFRVPEVVETGLVSQKIYSGENLKVSWEDWDFINYEQTRSGPGENGQEWIVTDLAEIEINEEWIKKEGFYVAANQKMSLTRTLPNQRPEICGTKVYNANLPIVSVIITFHNEINSTLLRTIHSIYNRSPKPLLHEILLVNDASTFPELTEPLQKYIKQFFGDKVKIVENKKRQGLSRARMTGAKAASGEVIVFLDSHMEVYNSWLPPLLDIIVEHPTYAAVPVTDGMDHKTFKPHHVGYGHRGIFDWNFRYQWLPLRKKDREVEGDPYDLACMTGGAYAIRRDHFFHLGGYDEGLIIWNGENYELSLKLWLCDGGMLACPCSRVTHLSKLHSAHRNTDKPIDFVGRNLKRVAEVWLDDYKQYFYRGDPKRYERINAGNLKPQFKKKKSLNCKPFEHYLNEVAPEILQLYPIVPNNFASGTIKSQADTRCFGFPTGKYETVGLMDCSYEGGNDFILTLEKSIKYNDTNDQCFDSGRLVFLNCHHQKGNQLWKFDMNTKQIISIQKNKCLTANITVYLDDCNDKVMEQKWIWEVENKTALADWDNNGIKFG